MRLPHYGVREVRVTSLTLMSGKVFPYFEPMTHRSQPSNLNSAKENPSRQQSISETRKYKEHSDKLRHK